MFFLKSSRKFFKITLIDVQQTVIFLWLFFGRSCIICYENTFLKILLNHYWISRILFFGGDIVSRVQCTLERVLFACRVELASASSLKYYEDMTKYCVGLGFVRKEETCDKDNLFVADIYYIFCFPYSCSIVFL